MAPLAKVATLAELQERTDALMRTILLSSNRRDITRAFRGLECLVRGKCICDMCPGWPDDVGILYEFGRCLVPTRFLQLIKARHIHTKRWEYVQPLYASLFQTVMQDVLPDTPFAADEGDTRCPYPALRPEVVDATLAEIRQERAARIRRV